MVQAYLVNKTIIAGYEDISMNVNPERINVFVKKAQDLDLKPFMGHAFFFDFIKHFNADGTIQSDAPQAYKDLLAGKEYTDLNGHYVIFEGIIPALVYWTFARFIEADAFRFTATGPVAKRHDDADRLTASEISKLVNQQRSVANAHANEIEKFLWDNKGDYPLWKYSERNKRSRQPGPRMTGIDRTEYNRAGYGNDSQDRFGLGNILY